MSSSAKRVAGALAGFGLCAALLGEKELRAEWPPPASVTADDLKPWKDASGNPGNPYWPNDPDYGYRPAEKTSDRVSGQWTFYSFIPERSPGSFVPPIRPGETAAGMSVDLAWRHTIGDDRVLICILDSGIKWDEGDLVEKAFLNIGELKTHLPVHANNSPCAPLDPTKPTENLFDCNGDGILTVADYAESPQKADKNGNGIFDAGDLIQIFSDDIDDDGNGYVDDISGWDFFKNDNDPYDDTRYGHGSGEARDSSAATNNAQGGAGICPKCRFAMLRVGDSFIANVQDFAKGVVYATDNHASVIQEALGTINMSSFAQRALDYAWSKGTVVVASMADENSRHHNVPATANHTMPVHAITMLGSDEQSTTAESFFAYNTCSNFGAENYLSASGTGCSSEATGRLSGLAGLVYSMGVQSKLDPPLSAGEVLQIFQMTADDIDVSESQQPGSDYFWSQPGFDQRFGYGRVNANAAVEWVKAGKIPPEVDITEPRWFDVLYKDQLTAAVPIVGTVRARRAPVYSVFVEWAPGVQPLDTQFKLVKSLENVKSSDMPVLGADGTPLATLDVRELDVSHDQDTDSPHGENDRTITVRVRAVAHYGGAIGDVKGELRRAYAVHEDPDLLDGFPVFLGATGESSPKLADIDGDGVRDIVVATSDGKLNVLTLKSGKPEPVKGFPFLTNRIDGLDPNGTPKYLVAPAYATPDGVDPDLGRESISATPAIADIDADGKTEIVVSTYEGSVYVIENDGTLRSGWPKRLPLVPSCKLGQPKTPPCMDTDTRIARGAFASPVLEDLDGDGKLEIIQAAFDGKLYVFRADASDQPGFPVTLHFEGGGGSGEYNRIMTTPSVADFNGDGIPDILVGSNEKLGKAGGAGAFYLIDGRGTKIGDKPWFTHWPVTTVSLNIFPLVAEGVPNSPATADFDGDGKPDAVIHGNASAPFIVPTDPGTQNLLSSTPTHALPVRVDPDTGDTKRGIAPTSQFGPDSKAQLPDTMFPLFATPAIGDLDQDGVPDVTSSGGSLTMAQSLLSSAAPGGTAQHLLAMWNGKTGSMMPASPIVLEDFTFFNNQAIADLTNDGYPEVVTGSGGYFVHAADACGREPKGWPKFVNQWVIATTAIGDINGDDKLEVVVNSRAGWLYAWKTPGSADGVIAWESYHHDNRNTGNYEVPLDRGKRLGGQGPLPVDSDGKCIVDEGAGKKGTHGLSAAGGCGCRTPGRPASKMTWLWLVVAFAPFIRRRRAEISL